LGIFSTGTENRDFAGFSGIDWIIWIGKGARMGHISLILSIGDKKWV
jgi:hypothetical protein